MRYFVRSVTLTLAVSLQTALAAPAFAAGPYTDDLSKCLIRSTTTADKTLLVKWFFSIFALHPDVSAMANISDTQRAELNKLTAQLYERLQTRDCVVEARAALKYEGKYALPKGYDMLGQVAGRALLEHPTLQRSIAEMEKQIDRERIERELGIEK